MNANDSKRTPHVNSLGKYGWLITFCSFLLYLVASGVCTDYLNVSVESIAARTGWNTAVMMSFSTIAGWITLATSFIGGSFVKKVGARKVMAVSLILFAICIFFYGSVNQLWLFAVLIILIASLDTIQNGMAMQSVIASWFPRKKGIVMGWATMGMSVSVIAGLPFFNWLNGKLGIENAYHIIGVFVLMVSVLCIVVVRNTPEERGVAPDNDASVSREELEAKAAKIQKFMQESPWTTSRLLKTKEVWLISIVLGIGMLTATGVASQFVVRMIIYGVDAGTAVSMLSIGGVCALISSYIWGWLDTKIGPKKVTTILMAYCSVAIIVMIVSGPALIGNYIGMAMFLSSQGGINNMLTSYTTTIFGRYDFVNANRVMYPIYTALRCSAYGIIGLAAVFGYTPIYMVFAGLSVAALILSFFISDRFIGRTM